MKPALRTASDRRFQEGSAYIVTLLVLFILTTIGLSLTLVTQTEMLIGSQERDIQNVFYASDAGLEIVTARVANLQTSPLCLEIRDTNNVPGLGAVTMQQQIAAIPALVGDTDCQGCQQNMGEQDHRALLFAVTSFATRESPDFNAAGDDIPVARRQTTQMAQGYPLPPEQFQREFGYRSGDPDAPTSAGDRPALDQRSPSQYISGKGGKGGPADPDEICP